MAAVVGEVAEGDGPGLTERVPPQLYFVGSAVFHYLGPSFAVLLFARVPVGGVAWMRIVAAALAFAVWRRPWRAFHRTDRSTRATIVALGAVFAAMNYSFYIAIDRLPLGTVAAIEFVGPVLLALTGARTARNLVALVLAAGGVYALADVRLAGEPIGFAWAFVNAGLFTLYIVLAHRSARGDDNAGGVGSARGDNSAGSIRDADRIASVGGARSADRPGNAPGDDSAGRTGAIDRLGASMLVAAVVITPLGAHQALPAFSDAVAVGAGVAVGLTSSVIPYVFDQLAMARISRSTYALFVALLPATAVLIGFVVLRQTPDPLEIGGVALVIAGVLTHQEPATSR